MAVPKRDLLLAPWSTNFYTRITATPTVFGLVAGQATAYGLVHTPYIAAFNAASVPGARSPALTSDRNTARAALLPLARELYAYVQANTSVSDANKTLLGIRVRKVEPTPVPPPATAPSLTVLNATGRTLRVRLSDPAEPDRRGRPVGVAGASIFSHVGTSAPTDLNDWKFEGNVGRTQVDVTFPSTVPNGSTVFLTAFWFNPRKQSGPACDAISVFLPGGGVSTMAA